jgi:hypothetical protein
VYNKRKQLNQKREEEGNISNITPGKREENSMILNNISNITPIPEEAENFTPNEKESKNNKAGKRKSSLLSNQNLLLSNLKFNLLL